MADVERPPRRYVLSFTNPSDRCRFATVLGLAGAEVTTAAPERAMLAPNTVLVTDLTVHGVDGERNAQMMILVLDMAFPVTASAYHTDTSPAIVLALIDRLG